MVPRNLDIDHTLGLPNRTQILYNNRQYKIVNVVTINGEINGNLRLEPT